MAKHTAGNDSRARNLRRLDIYLDPTTLLHVRSNGLWAVRRLTGSSHEHHFSGTRVHEGHVIARGHVRANGRTLKVTRSDLKLPELRRLVEPSGASYGLTVVK